VILKFLIGGALLLVASFELAFPGSPLYHYGWFNVLLAGMLVVLLMRTRGHAIVPAFGVAIVTFATIASGLLGPDEQVIVASPGESVRLDALGENLVFPLDVNVSPISGRVYRGAFVLEPVPRTVVRLEARDARGGTLTITQPTGEAFLSPVLLMRTKQTIDGFSLPFDSFAVPSLHRQIKAVLFDPADAIRMSSLAPGYSVLFDLQDDAERQVPGGIGVAHNGETRSFGNLRLRPTVLQYPGVRVIAIPDVRAVIAGSLIAIGGLTAAFLLTKRRPAL
jgi:hypothetical protein